MLTYSNWSASEGRMTIWHSAPTPPWTQQWPWDHEQTQHIWIILNLPGTWQTTNNMHSSWLIHVNPLSSLFILPEMDGPESSPLGGWWLGVPGHYRFVKKNAQHKKVPNEFPSEIAMIPYVSIWVQGTGGAHKFWECWALNTWSIQEKTIQMCSVCVSITFLIHPQTSQRTLSVDSHATILGFLHHFPCQDVSHGMSWRTRG